MANSTTNRIPRVSIGMPVYNAEAYVSQAIDSLLGQTFSDFELVVSDNASTDRTEDICRAYAADDARVVYDRLAENFGAVQNFNRVFTICRGEYFKWAACDDICLPTFLERCVDVLDANPEVVWCHTQTVKIDRDSRVLGPEDPEAAGLAHTSAAGLPRRFHDARQSYLRYYGVLLGTTWCADAYGLIRADALRRTRLLPACFGAEKVVLAELALLGKYREVPETLFHKRVHADAASSLKTGAEQAAFADPRSRNRFMTTRMSLLRGHVRAVHNAELGLFERVMCNLVIARYMLQIQKWRRVIANALFDDSADDR